MINYLLSFVNTNGVVFPDTEAVNVTAPGAGDGTEFVKLMVDDIWGRAQALLDYAGLIPDGVSEAPDTAQVLDAIGLGFGIGPGVGVTYWKNDTPAVHGDRVLLLQGQVVLIATYPLLDAAVYVGDPSNPTAPAFFRTSDAGGTIRNVAGPYLVLPDTRGLSLKNIGNATVNTRVKTGPVLLGEMQEDREQEHWHEDYFQDQHLYSTPTTDSGMKRLANTATNNQYNPIAKNTRNATTDGVHGTPRTGANTRDSIMGTNFGITY